MSYRNLHRSAQDAYSYNAIETLLLGKRLRFRLLKGGAGVLLSCYSQDPKSPVTRDDETDDNFVFMARERDIPCADDFLRFAVHQARQIRRYAHKRPFVGERYDTPWTAQGGEAQRRSHYVQLPYQMFMALVKQERQRGGQRRLEAA